MDNHVISESRSQAKLFKYNDIDVEVHIFVESRSRPKAHWGPRMLNDMELIFLEKGVMQVQMEGASLEVAEPGDWIWIPPGINHVLTMENVEGLHYALHLEPVAADPWLKGIWAMPNEQRFVFSSREPDYLRTRCLRGAKLFKGQAPGRNEQLRWVSAEILALFLRDMEKEQEGISRTEVMMEYIRQNMSKTLGRKDLAKAFHMSVENVNLLFRKELQKTPTEAIHREKMMYALTRLKSGDCSVKNVAYELGYSDALYFSRVFKKVMGVSPSLL